MSYAHYYSLSRLMAKLASITTRILELTLLKVCLLLELLMECNISLRIKAAIIAVFGYFIFPFDFIPDPLPGGYADDIAAMTALLASIEQLISEEIKARAKRRAERFRKEEAL